MVFLSMPQKGSGPIIEDLAPAFAWTSASSLHCMFFLYRYQSGSEVVMAP